VADPGFDLRRGAWTLTTGRGRGVGKALKVLIVELEVINSLFLVI